MELAYTLVNLSVLPFWLSMLVAPAHRITAAATAAGPPLYAALYTVLAVIYIGSGDGHMASLAGLRTAFESDGMLLLAWVHFLCFDMFIGAWELRDARRRGLPHRRLVPCLLLTLMFGPAGFGAYLLVRRLPHTR